MMQRQDLPCTCLAHHEHTRQCSDCCYCFDAEFNQSVSAARHRHQAWHSIMITLTCCLYSIAVQHAATMLIWLQQHQKHVQHQGHSTSNCAETMQMQIVMLALLLSCCRNYALRSWEETVPAFKYNPAMPYSQIFVPTADTVRFGALLTLALQVHRPVLLTGMSFLIKCNRREHRQESLHAQHPMCQSIGAFS